VYYVERSTQVFLRPHSMPGTKGGGVSGLFVDVVCRPPVNPKITLSPSRNPLHSEAELFKTPVDFGSGRQQVEPGRRAYIAGRVTLWRLAVCPCPGTGTASELAWPVKSWKHHG
jgi:hypothetical protein